MAKTKTPIKKTIIKKINLYKTALKSSNINVTRLILFGSQAKGTARYGSDIDLAVVSPSFGKDRHQERLKLMRLCDQKTIEIEPHPFHPNDLKERWSTMADEIRTYGQVITL